MSVTIQMESNVESTLTRGGGITVLARVNAKVDAASAVAAEREAQEERGRRTCDPRIESLD
jgi:hypothetical protein